MSHTELPILNFGRFRKYPTRQDQQQYADDRLVCRDCLSGGCCSSEDPVYLTSFDVFRFASFFNISPAEFLLQFTQERFGDPESDELRKILIHDPNCSIVTYLRRRANSPTSPCIFLKYIKDAGGTPRRICSVHDARPLACREFYFTTCKVRVSGELAALQAEGFEMIRDGQLTASMVDSELSKFEAPPDESSDIASNMQYFFWIEMKRALYMDQANVEGANSYSMADYQDPIDEKLNRVISAKHLRFEEKYGPRPRDEQLMQFTSGMTFAGSAEHKRIISILRKEPATGLYESGNYPLYVGSRMSFPGIRHSPVFRTIPPSKINTFLRGAPRTVLFPNHENHEIRTIQKRDVYAALLNAYNHLIRFAGYVATMGNVLEACDPGYIESDMFLMIIGFEKGNERFIAHNPYLQPIKEFMARIAVESTATGITTSSSPRQLFEHFRFLCRAKAAMRSLPPDLCATIEAGISQLETILKKEKLDLYVTLVNPIAIRAKSGKRLNNNRAWNEWFDQVLDMRYAAMLGFDHIDLQKFYEQSVAELEGIAFRKSYALDIYDIVCNLARSMGFHNNITYQDMNYQDSADRLAAYAVRLCEWMERNEYEHHNCEIMAGFLSPLYRGLGLGYNDHSSFGEITFRILDTQLPDGSWNTKSPSSQEPDSQSEYLCGMYRTTWACVEALLPRD